MRKFLGLTAADRSLLARAAWLLLATRCGLAWLGYERLRKILVRLNRPYLKPERECHPPVDRMIWALSTAGRTVLNSQGCLPLAIATQYWFNRCGVPTDMKIGVRRGATGKLEAHAWVERGGTVLIGGAHSVDQYEALPALDLWT